MNSMEMIPRSPAQITEALRKAALENKTIHSICLVFAMRERTRYQVNVAPLRLTMASEGYPLETKDIEQALIFFASIGIGKLYYDDKKRLKGLAEIRWTLQSVGKAALGEANTVVKGQPQRRYAPLPSTTMTSLFPKEQAPKAATPAPLKQETPLASQIKHLVFLVATISGREVRFPFPERLTSDEFMQLIADLNDDSSAKRGVGGH